MAKRLRIGVPQIRVDSDHRRDAHRNLNLRNMLDL